MDTIQEHDARLVVEEWNRTELADEPATVVERFAAQVARSPAATALTDEEGTTLGYDEVRRAANRLAGHLLGLGLRTEDRCAIYQRRSAGMVVSMFGTLAAGGAYVPIDEGNPPERVEAILRDAGTAVVLADSTTEAEVPPGPWFVVNVDDHPGREEDDPGVPLHPANLAYVMYTSGSTGTPKGVLIEHRAVTAFVRGAQHLYGLSPQDRLVQFSSIAFDVSTFDAFGALLSGATLHVAAAETRTSAERFRDLLRERRISVYMGTPGMLRLLEPGDFPDLRVLAVGGESYSGEFTTRWAAGRRFVNSYGPTETTVGVITQECRGSWDTSPPIGRAMPNHRAYALDTSMCPVPIGTVGELYVGGPGLGRGYLDRPGTSALSFVPDPFATTPGERLYRTGDLVRWTADGELVFAGRADRQVKVRGVRVEPEEIEQTLRRHPAVAHAVVEAEARGDGDARLIAYVVSTTGEPPGVTELRETAARWLTAPLVPNEFVHVPEIPLTPAGKVDRDALAAARQERAGTDAGSGAGSDDGSDDGAEWTPTRRRVAEEIVKPLLGVDSLGPHDHFFELGGTSIQVIQLLGRVRTIFGIEVPVADFFDRPTIAGVADAVDSEVRSDLKDIVREGWDDIADRYAAFQSEFSDGPRMQWTGHLLAMLPAGGSVLELGVGGGHESSRRLAEAHALTAVDISAEQLKLAERTLPGATLVQADMAQARFPDAAFDAVVSIYTLTHLPREELPGLLGDIARWLKPGGLLLATLMTEDIPGAIEEWFGSTMFFSGFPTEENLQLLRAAGLVPEREEVVAQRTPLGESRFLWVIARRTETAS
ncbi:amino acid adenylation domain-containing protein [Streptosporangium sp. NPDC001681]|uniref:non-ribosomal peptide synthetase n=1 Tax=Streptosporangium sp. NPDC001681 TaxID=3154395 RepID=UPI003327C453